MVMGNEALLALATDPPKSMKELSARKGIGDRLLQRHGKDLLEVVKHALELPKDQWPQVPRGKRWPRDPDYDDRLKRLKQVRDRLTQEHDLRMGIVASNQMLADIARTLPGDIAALAAVPGMRRYQMQHFGADLLKAL
jgi:ribonuclease D